MPPDPGEGVEIKETDIVFDCSYCSKSLAIDYRGAGLIIKCSDCGSDVQVPIPEGMELTDIDSSDEEQEVRILNLRRSLAAAQYRIRLLESDMGDLRVRRETLENNRSDSMFRMGTIVEKLGIIEAAVKEITKALADISKLCRENE